MAVITQEDIKEAIEAIERKASGLQEGLPDDGLDEAVA